MAESPPEEARLLDYSKLSTSPMGPRTPPPSPVMTRLHDITEANETPDLIKSATDALQCDINRSDTKPSRSRCSSAIEHNDEQCAKQSSTLPDVSQCSPAPAMTLDIEWPVSPIKADQSSSACQTNLTSEAIFDCSLSSIKSEPKEMSVQACEKPSHSETTFAQQADEYQLKWISWKGIKTPIITQNSNGPCPIIAIMNVLLLNGKVKLPQMAEFVQLDLLMDNIVDCMIKSLPTTASEAIQLNYEQNIQDALMILPKLSTGLDVNVRFTSVTSFEFTTELLVFDLLTIPLYHGWLVDHTLSHQSEAVGNCTYNQLVEKIVNNKFSLDPARVAQALIAENFLESTASQLTYPGLIELISGVKEDEPSILFRNNHFITLYKLNNQLYQLITDQGFVTESTKVWETLNNVDGDSVFVDSEFKVSPCKSEMVPMAEVDRKLQEDRDLELALALMEEERQNAERFKEWDTFKSTPEVAKLSDHELALKLQHKLDEDASAMLVAHDDPYSTPPSSRRTKMAKHKGSPQIRESRTGSASSHRSHRTREDEVRDRRSSDDSDLRDKHNKSCIVM